MAKQAGMGDRLFVAGYDLSGDIGSLSRIGGGPAALEVTGIDKSAFERIGGLRDGAIEFSAWFNPANTPPDVGAHERLSALPTTDQIVTYCRGTALGGESASLVAKQLNYDPTRNQDGSLSESISAQANGFGLEWDRQLTAGKRTDGAPANGASVDFMLTDAIASTAFGWQAWLHVFAFTGTSVTVTIEDSADNAAFALLSGATFTAASGITSQRLESASRTATVRRYLRAVTAGTFSSAVFAVQFTRNTVLTPF